MATLKVYGNGFAKCNLLEANADAAAEALGLDYTIEKITDRAAITDAVILITPALMVDGGIKVSGKAPGPKALRAVLQNG